MSKPRDDGQAEMFRPAHEQIIDLGHPLVRSSRSSIGSFWDAVWRGIPSGAWSTAIADPADRQAFDPQAHAQSIRRSAVRALGGGCAARQ